MSSQKHFRTSILFSTFVLSCYDTRAQGSENAIAASVFAALLAGGLILFLIVMPIVAKLSRRNKRESTEDHEIDSSPIDNTEEDEGPDPLSLIAKGCITLIICLVVGAMIVTMMFK